MCAIRLKSFIVKCLLYDFRVDVPSPPSGVRLANIKSRSLEITWIGPHDGNSPILNYVIEYSNLPGKISKIMTFISSIKLSNIIL